VSAFHADLDDVSEDRMWLELGRREGLRRQGKCDYCERPWDSKPACKHDERHSPPAEVRAPEMTANKRAFESLMAFRKALKRSGVSS
jgi:hypothetical protein